MPKLTKRMIVAIGAFMLLLWLFVPTTDLVAPDWNVLVTDTTGHPISDASVTIFSQQYTVESHDTESTAVTGDDGNVHFHSRRVRAIGIARLLGVLRNLNQGAHASFGVHTYLHADKKGYGDPSTLEMFAQNERESTANGAPQQSSHIVLMQCSPGYSGFGCDFPDDPAKPVLPLQR